MNISNNESVKHVSPKLLFSVRIVKIVLQPSKFKPINTKPIELEAIRLKRARVDMVLRASEKESRICAVIEFRGSAVTLSRSSGDFDVREVGHQLGAEYYKRYGKESLRSVDQPRSKDESVCEYTLVDPGRFLDFLHLIKNRKELDVYEASDEPSVLEAIFGLPSRNESGDSGNVQVGKADYSANELVERVYTPLLNETTPWLNPGAPFVGNLVGGMGWSELQTKVPYLLRLVPPDIIALFQQAKGLQGRIGVLALSMPPFFDKATATAARKLDLAQVSSANQVGFRIKFGPGTLQIVWIGTLWASGKTLKQYATDFINESYPGSDWDLELVVDNATVGDHNTTLRFAGAAETYLSQEQKASEFRQKYLELKELGVKARRRIDEELDKMVRLKT